MAEGEWSLDSLKEHFEWRLAGVNRRIDEEAAERRRIEKTAAEEREKAAAALRENLAQSIEAGDANLRDHIRMQIVQVHQSLDANERLSIARKQALAERIEAVQRELVIQNEASERAIAKAEAATDKRFESVNEWRGQSLDRERSMQEETAKLTARFMPREVVENIKEQLGERITILERSARFSEGREKGVGISAGVFVGSLGALATVITIIVVLANVFTSGPKPVQVNNTPPIVTTVPAGTTP